MPVCTLHSMGWMVTSLYSILSKISISPFSRPLGTRLSLYCIASSYSSSMFHCLWSVVCMYFFLLYDVGFFSQLKFAEIYRKETEFADFITHLHLLLHIATLDIEALLPWHQFTYSALVPDGRLAIQRAQIVVLQMFGDNFVQNCRDTSDNCWYISLIVKCRFSRMMRFTFCFNASVMTEGRPDLSAPWTSVRNRLQQVFGEFHWVKDFRLQKPNMPRTSQSAGFDMGTFIVTTRYIHNVEKFTAQLQQATIYTRMNTPNDSSGTMMQLRWSYAQRVASRDPNTGQ